MKDSPTAPGSFERGARRYDLMVALNPGYHRHLRAAARELVSLTGTPGPLRLLDLACGSGASTRALVDAAPEPSTVRGIDASAGMLDRARRRRWPPSVTFEQGEVGALEPGVIEPGSWQGVLACYLLRNVPADRRDRALAEIHGALEPGGWFVTEEYSVRERRTARLVWTIVCWLIIIPLGIVVGRDGALYRYLWRSVRDFDGTTEVEERLRRAGFEQVGSRTVGGWQRHILHIFRARKPDTGR